MNTPLKIENENLILETDNPAGQMISLVDKKNGREVLYQADQGWSGRNPSLFPMIGKTWNDGKYLWKGHEYQMKNHGLIRYEDLEGKAGSNTITYSLDSDEETRSKYPFDFHFELKYTLEGDRVRVSYAITNTGDENMPFSFGLHPAFKTVQNSDEKFEDFSIDFSPAEEAEQIVFFADQSPVRREKKMLDSWNLNYEDLEEYATLVFDRIQAKEAVLRWKDEPRMKMTFDGFPSVALWNPGKGNDFICIEPWFGHTDFEKVDVPFDQREGVMILAPQETFTASYTIEPLH